MLQRIFMIVVIVAIIFGGGYYAYIQLMPPVSEEATGPIYSTKEVIKDDITVGVDAVGGLNPSSGGGIQVPGNYNYNGGTSTTYVIDQILVQAGTEVKQGDVIVKLLAPDLKLKIDAAREQLRIEREALASLMNVSIDKVDSISPSNGITLRAPIDGRIVSLSTKEGLQMKQGEIVARIVDDSRFEIIAKLTPGEFSGITSDYSAVLQFAQFDTSSFIPAKIVDINPNPIPVSSAELDNDISMGSEDSYEFVYWVTIEGENPGLLQPGMKARIGFIDKKASEITVEDSLKIQWIRNYSTIEKFVNEERLISSADGTVTQVYVHQMEPVKANNPIIALAGEDVRSKIQEKLDRINEKKIEIQQLEAQVGMLDIKAPMDGVVADLNRQPGQTVQPGEWLGSIYNTSEMYMWVQVDDVDILLVKQGAKVDVTVDAITGKVFEGEVERVATMGKDMSGIARFEVVIKVKGSSELRPGMQANAYIKAGEAKDSLLIPLEAVFQEDNQYKVEILQPDGTPKVISVELGLMNDRYAEVKSGLEEGQKVITGSTADLLPSQKIKSNGSLLPTQEGNNGNDGNNGGNNDGGNNTQDGKGDKK